ncbi:molybdopterin biosynthesis protein MoeB (plasmid) [Pseudosulfitobacter pseudonitzschiae]|uniref:Molybdopterin biosynthesis protein MoeB n=2 Tax=Rhodobacterales TaxID=204455 RepID=A0A221K876_9RHOB|nr:molybdopterin biosynthesis protein MoeB [Pseudosulfitobacter pseudonitzschiae]
MLDEADASVTSVDAADMAAQLGAEDIVMVDIRDPRELEREGMIPDAFHAPRGMLEFWIDPASPYHKPRFAEGKTYVFYCASGWRSLLAAKVAQEMGLDARSLRGGFSGWKSDGNPVGELQKRAR